MKLFVSYRRKSWPFAQRLVEELRKLVDAEVFIDYSGVDEVSFERSILRHIRESTAVLVVVSDQTFERSKIFREDDWVRREIRLALELDKPIILVGIDGLNSLPSSDDLPNDIQKVLGFQGVAFYPEFFDTAVGKLADFITKTTPVRSKHSTWKRNAALAGVVSVFVALFSLMSILNQGNQEYVPQSNFLTLTSLRILSPSGTIPTEDWQEGSVLYVTAPTFMRMQVDSSQGIGAGNEELDFGEEVVVIKNIEGRVQFAGRTEQWWHVRPTTEITGGGWIPRSLLTTTRNENWLPDALLFVDKPGEEIWMRQEPNGSEIIAKLRHRYTVAVIDDKPAWNENQWWWYVRYSESETETYSGWLEQSILKPLEG